MIPITLIGTAVPRPWAVSAWSPFKLIQAGTPTHWVFSLMSHLSAFFSDLKSSILFTFGVINGSEYFFWNIVGVQASAYEICTNSWLRSLISWFVCSFPIKQKGLRRSTVPGLWLNKCRLYQSGLELVCCKYMNINVYRFLLRWAWVKILLLLLMMIFFLFLLKFSCIDLVYVRYIFMQNKQNIMALDGSYLNKYMQKLFSFYLLNYTIYCGTVCKITYCNLTFQLQIAMYPLVI